jgi:hypothetical protein
MTGAATRTVRGVLAGLRVVVEAGLVAWAGAVPAMRPVPASRAMVAAEVVRAVREV